MKLVFIYGQFCVIGTTHTNQQSPEKKETHYPSTSTDVPHSMGHNTPMEVERDVDLISAPSQFTEVTREPGWSIVHNGNQPHHTTTQPNAPPEGEG